VVCFENLRFGESSDIRDLDYDSIARLARKAGLELEQTLVLNSAINGFGILQ
jgi:hypothetical protein